MRRLKLVTSFAVFFLALCAGVEAGEPNEAINLYNQHKYAESVRSFEAHYNATMADPNSAYYYALALVAAGQTERAIQICEYIAKRHPKTPGAKQAEAALALWKQKESPKAALDGSSGAPSEPKTNGVIGIRFEARHNDYPVVVEVYSGGPAVGQLKVGDKILAVDHIDVRGFSLDKVFNLTAGTPNTAVKITVYRDPETLVKTLVRLDVAQLDKTNPEVRKAYEKQRQQDEAAKRPPKEVAKTDTVQRLSANNSITHASQFLIHYTMDGPKYMVPVRINGRELKMCLDTGCNRTIIPMDFIDEVGLPRPRVRRKVTTRVLVQEFGAQRPLYSWDRSLRETSPSKSSTTAVGLGHQSSATISSRATAGT